ncbi:MAG: SWIM zinc finger family protein [Lachnospiraceae bacterium]|nr:SWIM zinc finger family protein [Lachnospiraceae bacterium]
MKYLRFFPIWKLAIFALFIVCVPSCLFTPNPYGLINAVFSTIICLIIAISPMLSDVLYIKTPAERLWKRWTFVEGEKAQARKERAAYGELTPTYIDTELKYGLFAGTTNGKYRTTLRRCSCPDFKKRKVPCKHMYYLAAKCGVESLK